MWSHRIGATTKLLSLQRLSRLPSPCRTCRMQDPLLLWGGQTRQTARKRPAGGCSRPYAATTSTTLSGLAPHTREALTRRRLDASASSADQATPHQPSFPRGRPVLRKTQMERFTRAPPTRLYSHNVPRRVEAEHDPAVTVVRSYLRLKRPHGCWRGIHAHAVQCHAMLPCYALLLASLSPSGSMPRAKTP